MAEGGEEELVIKEEYFTVPVAALNTSIRNILSALDLNIGTIDPKTGLTPDWRGLAELMGFTADETNRVGQRDGSRVNVLLTDWTTSQDNSVGNLLTYIEQLQRVDVLGRLTNTALDRDHIEKYKKKNRPYVFPDSKPASLWPAKSNHDDGIVTREDVREGRAVTYDAFVCFDLKDLDFVKLLLDKLEKEPHNITFCVCPRDLLAGTAEHSVTAMLIEKRCKRLVLIYSPNSVDNEEVDFVIKFTHALEPGARRKRIVPLNLGGVDKHPLLNFVAWLDFSKRDLHDWLWDRLSSSLNAPIEDPGSLLQNVDIPAKLTSSEREAALDQAGVRTSRLPVPCTENGKNETRTDSSSTNKNAEVAASSVLPVPPCGNGKNASPSSNKPPSPYNHKGQRLQPTEDEEPGERPTPPGAVTTDHLLRAAPNEVDLDTLHINQPKDKDTKPTAKPNKPKKKFKFPFFKGQ